MPTNTVLPPVQLFTGTDGSPLEGGYVYIGMPGFEARSTPKASYFDAALTIPTGTSVGAAVRTGAGYPLRNGLPATIYVDGDHSITVTDRNLRVVFTALNRAFELGTPTSLGMTLSQPLPVLSGGTGRDNLTDFRADLGFAQTTGTPRRLLFPGNMMMQGGTGTTSGAGALALSFPFAFSATPTLVMTPIAAAGVMMTIASIGPTGATVNSWVSNVGSAASITFHWMAFGEA
jgi:hypothetical protein